MNDVSKLATVLALLSSSTGWAVCVTTTNDLAIALQQAETTPLDIQVAKGAYRLDLTPWGIYTDYPNAKPGTTVIGGYNADCSSRDPDPSGTVFTDTGAAHSYLVYPDGDFTLESITFDLAGHFYVEGGSVTSADAAVTLRRIVVSGTHLDSTDAALALFWIGNAGTNGSTRVVDSLFYGSTPTACALAAQADFGEVSYTFVNVTASDNGLGICLYDETPNGVARFSLYNTISSYNAVVGLKTDTQQVTLVNDSIGTQDTPGPFFPAPIGLSTSDPQLNGSYVPIAPGSPSIDSGTQIVPGGLPSTDIAGNPRVVGNDVDRGAYESSYDNATTQLVTNTADSGPESLRAAIHNANLTAGKNTVKFQIGVDCSPVKVIQIDSNLEAIAGDTTIKGFSQPGASRNTLDIGNDANVCIILEPAASSTATDGLRVTSPGTGVNLTVEGLAIGGFAQDGISLLGGGSHNINGNHFGGSVGGHALAANNVNVRIGADVHDVTIGGDGAGQRNLIGGAIAGGVFVTGTNTPAHDNQIVNNYIGIGWSSGFTNRGNGTNGIYLAGSNNTVTDNLIGNNGNDGIDVDSTAATGNSITRNSIGGSADGSSFANGLAGVRVENAGRDNTINSNTIANNANAGVRIVSGVRNKIRKNAIYANGGLGIDLAAVDVTPNDDDGGLLQVDYANRGLNFPLLATAAGGHYGGNVGGSLTTTPGDYTIDLYTQSGCDGSGNGEGRLWLRGVAVTVPVPVVGNQGTVNFSASVSLGFPLSFTGSRITATATDSVGNTSEFSACRLYTDDTIFTDGFNYGSI